MQRARRLRPYTDQFFRAVGLEPGMRVRDWGSGVGDVALLVVDIVGPRGRVLGLDRDTMAFDRARERTAEQGCSSRVSFQAGNLDEFTTGDPFDAVVGRLVLMYRRARIGGRRRCCAPAWLRRIGHNYDGVADQIAVSVGAPMP